MTATATDARRTVLENNALPAAVSAWADWSDRNNGTISRHQLLAHLYCAAAKLGIPISATAPILSDAKSGIRQLCELGIARFRPGDLDVLNSEPIVREAVMRVGDHVLRECPDAIITPHVREMVLAPGTDQHTVTSKGAAFEIAVVWHLLQRSMAPRPVTVRELLQGFIPTPFTPPPELESLCALQLRAVCGESARARPSSDAGAMRAAAVCHSSAHAFWMAGRRDAGCPS